jgi:cytidyltransferase-like protein
MIDFRNFFLREEKGSKLIVIFPGRFQPFHTGHKRYYENAKKKFPGADFYIATASNTSKSALKEPEKYPFNFNEKKEIITSTGINSKEVVECVNPYTPIEIVKNYNKELDKLIILVGEKDMLPIEQGGDPRFQFTPTKSGAPSYFQPYKGLDSMVPFAEHGYIDAPGTITFDIDGVPCQGATELRREFRNGDEKKRKRIVAAVVGHPNEKIYNLFVNKLVA